LDPDLISFGKPHSMNIIDNRWVEIWREIIVDERKTSYEISNLGRVRNVNTLEFKKPKMSEQGYVYIQLHVGKRLKKINVHRLVAKAFIPNLDNKPEVNHIDGIKFHNMWVNLEWVTREENLKHAIENGLMTFKKEFQARHNIYTKEQITKVINLLKLKKMTSQEVADATGVGVSTVCYIRNGKSYVRLADELGFEPETKHNFDFSPYEEKIREMINRDFTNKEIRTTLPLNVNNSCYDHFIRKIKKSQLKCSTTIQMVT